MRLVLNQEVHARPYEWLEAPVYLANLAFLSNDVETERALLRAYCAQHQIELSAPLENFFSASVGNTRLRWERHTEFSSYTFMVSSGGETPFERSAVQMMPDGWLGQIPGQLLVAVDVVLEAEATGERPVEEVAALFGGNAVAGSVVIDEAATVYSDFHLHAHNRNRFLVQDRGLRQRQAGRLVQRLLEIETYRMLSLMGLPLAREVTPELAALENQLVALTERMTAASDMATDQGLLGELTSLAAQIEQIAARTEYRFSATEAYFALVNRRVGELRETRIPGVQTIAEFMERRLVPAVKTCDAVSKRVQGLSKRVSRASNLLRTRVDISMEAQSRDLLDSMNRRAELQLRLQETVEGLSVVVLSYCGVGLVGYLLKAIKAAGVSLNVDLLTGLSVPVVIGLVFFGVHRLRERVEGRDKKFN
jgi:uncharacterized membrane-anchored protein